MDGDVQNCKHIVKSDDDEFFCSSDGGIHNDFSDQLGEDDSIFELYKQHKVSSLKRRIGSSLFGDVAEVKSKKVRDASVKNSELCHFSLKYFGDIIQSLSPDQISVIEAYGFGSLLKFDKCSVPKNFVKWIASIIDVRTSEIIFKDRVIPFSKQSVHKILGMPVGGKPLCSDSEAGKSFLLSKFKLQNLGTVQYYGDKLMFNKDLSDDEVFLCFMVVAIGCFICPDSSFVPSTDLIKVFEQPLQVRLYDWSLYLYDLMMAYVLKLRKQPRISKKGSHVLNASSYVLAVLYLDCVDFGSHKVSQEIPRISYWKGSVLKYCSELDQMSLSKFGRRPLKAIVDTTYTESFLKLDESIATGFSESSVPSEFKAKLESLYGDILPDELKYGICNIYATHFTEESKRMNLSCQALIFKIFSFCNELSAKFKDVRSAVEDQVPHVVDEPLNFLSEHVVQTPTIGNLKEKCHDVEEDIDLSLKCGLNVQTSICDAAVPTAKNCRLSSDVAKVNEKVEASMIDNDVIEYQKVVELSTPTFIMNRNISSSAPSLLIADPRVVKQKKFRQGEVIGCKPSLFDLNTCANELGSENYITPIDHVIEVDTVKKMGEVEEIFGFDQCYMAQCPNVSPDTCRYVYDVETQQYVRVRKDVCKDKFVSKNGSFLSKLQIGDLNLPLHSNEVTPNKISTPQVNANIVHNSLPHQHSDKDCILLGSKAPFGTQKDFVIVPDGDEEIDFPLKQSNSVPLIDLDEEEAKQAHDANEVKIMGEVLFKDKITAMCNKSDILYNKTLVPGASSMIGDGAGPSVVQPVANASKVGCAFDVQGFCKPQAWSKKYVVTKKEKLNYIAACRLASSTKWNDKNAVEIGGCYVKYRELGNSLRTGAKVGSFVINALCRKFFLDKRPTISRKHYFFSSVGAVVLKGCGSLSYVKNCFDGAASVLPLHRADMLLFPICHDDHWFLFVVDLKNSLFVFLDSYYSGDDYYHIFIRENLVPNFKRLYKELVNGPLDFENFDVVYPAVPKQDNLVDCGVFVIMFLTFWTWYCGMCIEFSQKDIDNIRIHTVSSLVCSEHNIAYATPITNYFGPGSFPRVGEIRKATVQN
ncbi:hypothetical protein ACP70R_018759 [Stipagrostis hirtigluma subsp. patula]